MNALVTQPLKIDVLEEPTLKIDIPELWAAAIEEVMLHHPLAGLAGGRVATAKSLGGEIAYANRPLNWGTRNRSVGTRYLTYYDGYARPVATGKSTTVLRPVTK